MSSRNLNTLSTDSFLSSTPTINKEEPIIGIDLGTTYSCVSIFKNNISSILENKNGKRTTPSIITCKENEILIGQAAENSMYTLSNFTIKDSKRFIGKFFNDPKVQKDIKYLPVKIIEDPYTKRPQYYIKHENQEARLFSPIDVAYLLLKDIKTFSEERIGGKIKKAVITVPAHFNNLQREETIEAAKKAGLEVYKIINEPTAAAIAYGDIIKSDKERKVLIFDLGGGTFDVSIVKIKGNEYTVLASEGEEHLGGEDITQRLTDYALNIFKKINNFENVDFYNQNNIKEYKVLQRIKKSSEEVKIQLSFAETVQYDIDSLYKEKDFNYEIKQSTLNEICGDLFNICIKKVDETLKKINLTEDNIDEVVLVGGSCRIPKIKEMLIKKFSEKKVLKNINADEVIAQGAALIPFFGSKINDNIFLKQGKINEITSLSIGIEIANYKMEVIIKKGTLLPKINEKKSFNKTFKTQSKTSKNVLIKIFEGEGEYVWENHLLGKFTVSGFNNDNIIEIEMILDHNSIITVIGKIKGEKEQKLIISKNDFYDEIEVKNYQEKLKFINESREKISQIFNDK